MESSIYNIEVHEQKYRLVIRNLFHSLIVYHFYIHLLFPKLYKKCSFGQKSHPCISVLYKPKEKQTVDSILFISQVCSVVL